MRKATIPQTTCWTSIFQTSHYLFCGRTLERVHDGTQVSLPSLPNLAHPHTLLGEQHLLRTLPDQYVTTPFPLSFRPNHTGSSTLVDLFCWAEPLPAAEQAKYSSLSLWELTLQQQWFSTSSYHVPGELRGAFQEPIGKLWICRRKLHYLINTWGLKAALNRWTSGSSANISADPTDDFGDCSSLPAAIGLWKQHIMAFQESP